VGASVNYPKLKSKTAALDAGEFLGPDENPFSTNKVTGYSLNYPIGPTCVPTEVCVKTCYFGRGPSTWTAALKKQHRLRNSTLSDPRDTALRIVNWAFRLDLSFVRWNGGGDLFAEAVECLNIAAPLMPGIPQWVVTRLPQHAVNIAPQPNVYVHFSLDRSSWTRAAALRPLGDLQWFWSYQCAPDEVPPQPVAPVVLRDGYDPKGSELHPDDCPLNAAADITGVCESCRRCFNGQAVSRGRELLHVLDERIG
jgi:hypothetical protein